MLKGFPSRKDSIILAAIDIIGENGVQALSTKEIAARQGISESLLYKHFKSLDQVLVAAIKYFSRFDSMIINSVLKKDMPSREKILEFIRSFVELYEGYPALAAIVLNYEILMHYDHTRETVIDIIEKRVGFLLRVVEEGQKRGEIGNCYTCQQLVDIIYGTVKAMILRWKMSGYDFSLKKDVLVTIKKLLDKC